MLGVVVVLDDDAVGRLGPLDESMSTLGGEGDAGRVLVRWGDHDCLRRGSRKVSHIEPARVHGDRKDIGAEPAELRGSSRRSRILDRDHRAAGPADQGLHEEVEALRESGGDHDPVGVGVDAASPTEVAGERVMRSLVMLFGRLHLRVNEAKSAVAPAASRPFLSFTLSIRHDAKTEPLVAPKALQTMKDRVRQLTRRTRGRSLAEVVQSLAVYLNGWLGYFRVARTKKRFQEMDGWIRHRLRAYQLKQWKRGPTVFRELRARGLSATAAARVAGNAKRWWRNSAMAINAAIPNAFFDGLGLPRLAP